MLSISHHIVEVFFCLHHQMNHLRAARETYIFILSKYINVSILFALVSDGRHNSRVVCFVQGRKEGRILNVIYRNHYGKERSCAHSPAAIKSILNLLMLDETAVELDDVVDEPVNDDNDRGDLLLFVVPLPPRLCVKLCRRRSQLRRNTLPQEQ